MVSLNVPKHCLASVLNNGNVDDLCSLALCLLLIGALV